MHFHGFVEYLVQNSFISHSFSTENDDFMKKSLYRGPTLDVVKLLANKFSPIVLVDYT